MTIDRPLSEWQADLSVLRTLWFERYQGGHTVLWNLFASDTCVADLVLEEGYVLVRLREWNAPGKFTYPASKFRSLDKAKSAAEKAAQAEWKRFVTQLYTPNDLSH